MDESAYANLIWRGHKSTDFGLKIGYPFNLVHPVPDLQMSHINGRNGDFVQDEGSYQNVTESFDVYIDKDANISQNDWQRNVIDWLIPSDLSNQNYDYLQLDVDPEYVFYGVVQNLPTFTWDTETLNPNLGSGTITFYCSPFQYRVNGITYQELPDTGTVYNFENQTAIPNWHFIVNGTFVLNVNGIPYEFENMPGEFWLNGDTGDTCDNDNKLYNDQTQFPNLSVPRLKPGENSISITANTGTTVTKAEYMPRWRRLI